jgi:hypothetical protein
MLFQDYVLLLKVRIIIDLSEFKIFSLYFPRAFIIRAAGQLNCRTKRPKTDVIVKILIFKDHNNVASIKGVVMSDVKEALEALKMRQIDTW